MIYPVAANDRLRDTLRRLALAALLCTLAAPLAAGPAPSVSDVQRARAALTPYARDGVEEALSVLCREGSLASLKAIADFGASSLYRRNSILAVRALVEKGPDTAAEQMERLVRRNRRRSERMARVATMLEQVPGPSSRKHLLKLARSQRDVVAVQAVRALGARGESESRKTLHRVLVTSSKAEVAGPAAFALSRLPPTKETKELLFTRVQRSSNDRVGDACALALSRMQDSQEFADRALALLIGRSSNDSFHALVKLAIWGGSKPDRELLERALRSASQRVREVACDLIGLKRVPGFQKRLLRLATTEDDWRNTVAAWLALRRSGIDEVLDGIAANIRRDGEPSYWAIQCAIKQPDASLAVVLRKAALDTKDAVRRELAQRALRSLPGAAAATRSFYLDVARKRRGTETARVALLGLGNLKDQASFHTLVYLLEKEPERRFDLWILAGLEKLTGHYYEPNPEIWKSWFKVVGGRVSYEPKPIDRKANRKRVAKIQRLGISPRTEAAVENGLLWLSRHQDLSGSWNGVRYHEHCVPKSACAAPTKLSDFPLAHTGLALLAFQGAGYSHRDGPYRDVIQHGLEYILAQQDYDGSQHDQETGYERAIGCQALCDGFGLTGDPWLGHGAQRMLDYLVKIQYPGGTWRYAERDRSSDTSVVAWALMACISARHAGLDVPEQAFVASEVWFDTASDPRPRNEFEVFVPDQFRKDRDKTYFTDVSYGRRGKVRDFKTKTSYVLPNRGYTTATTAIGLVARIWLGRTRAHPFCIGSANQVLTQIPGYDRGLEGAAAFYASTWYYGSLAMYQMGGRYWTRWRDECIKGLVANQRRDGCQLGSWRVSGKAFNVGTVYYTAMATLTLETFYRYQPYLARHDIRSRKERD